MDKELIDKIDIVTKELLQKLTLPGTFTITEKDETLEIVIDTPDPGILIGSRGRSLEALQILLGQLVFKKTGQWTRLTVSVGDYRERRNEQLKQMAQQALEKAVETKSEVVLEELSPADRRIIHMTLAQNPLVISESQGEGRHRRLIVKPRE